MASCPICKKTSNENFLPFCSSHCKNVDLLKWLKEEYYIPSPSSETSVPSEEEDF